MFVTSHCPIALFRYGKEVEVTACPFFMLSILESVYVSASLSVKNSELTGKLAGSHVALSLS